MPPTAVIQGSASITERSSIELQASSSYDPDGAITSYSWNVSGLAENDIAVSGINSATLKLTIGEIVPPMKWLRENFPELRTNH